jgi:hypothetical protein
MDNGFWWGNLREDVHLEDPGVEWKIIVNWILKTWDGGRAGAGSKWLG